MMDPSRVEKIRKGLSKYIFKYAVVSSAPAVATFTDLRRSIDYFPYPAGKSALSFFKSSIVDVLWGKGNEDAVSRLVIVLDDIPRLKDLARVVSRCDKEAEQFVHLTQLFIKPLSATCWLNAQEYGKKLLSRCNVQGIERINMGMGTSATWHGAPDCLCDVTPVVNMPFEDDTDSDSNSSGGKVTVDAKRYSLNFSDLNQIVGHAVVMSFIHHRRHPSQGPAVPAIGISCGSGEFNAALYDCVNDILLHLQPIIWWDQKNNEFDEAAVTLLWLLINHKLFFTDCCVTDAACKAGLSTVLAQNLSKFQQLDTYDACTWYATTYPRESDDYVLL